MSADFDARLGCDDVSLTRRDCELLEAVAEHESLNAAADALDRSYSHAQRRIVELEEAFGSLVERSRGGSGGGGSELTETARQLLIKFARLQTEFAGVADTAETILRGSVVARDGELTTVETDAGRVRAVTPEQCEQVEITIRADTVTLNNPTDAPEPDATSARNRFEGVVARIDRGTSLALVDVDIGVSVGVGAATTLSALVTRSSLDQLDLAVDDDIIASFKATATRAVPAAPA